MEELGLGFEDLESIGWGFGASGFWGVWRFGDCRAFSHSRRSSMDAVLNSDLCRCPGFLAFRSS